MKLSHGWSRATSLFDDENLVSHGGLVPVMALAEQTGLAELVAERVWLASARVASAAVNPAGKVCSIIAGMAAGADSIDDLDVVRSGGMPRLFTGVYASAAPVVTGIRLRAGKAGSGRGAGSMVREAIGTARAAGGSGRVLVRGDSAFGISAVVQACLRSGAQYSLVLAKNPAVNRAIAAIAEDA